MKAHLLLLLCLVALTTTLSAQTISSVSATGPSSNSVSAPQQACFQPAQSFHTGTSLGIGPILTDVNGDAILDLITPIAYSTDVFVLLGQNDGRFGTATRVEVGRPLKNIQVGDVNGDGKLDLVIIVGASPPQSYDDAVSILLGNGNGSFASPQYYITDGGPLYHINSFQLTDLNADNRLDLVILINRDDHNYDGNSSSYNEIVVHLNNGDGSFAPLMRYTPRAGSGDRGVTVVDVNGDNRPDLVTANYIYTIQRSHPAIYTSNSISVLLNQGDGTFANVIPLTISGNGPGKPMVSDLNGDGKLDIVVANIGSNNVSVYTGNGNGSFSSPVNFVVGGSYSSPSLLGVQDINSDGQPDLIGQNTELVNQQLVNRVWVLLNQGNNSFGTVSYFPLSGPVLTLNDVTGDGQLDIVAEGKTANSVSVQVGQGNGSFGEAVEFATGGIQGGLLVANLNQDTLPDLLSIGSDDAFSVLLGCQSPLQPCLPKAAIYIPLKITRIK